MISISPWFERSFRLDLEEQYFPLVVERLRGAPVRLNDLVLDVPHERLVSRTEDKWSVQEHAGHLYDLESLWYGRVEDILAETDEMRAADLTNRATFEANHNQESIQSILLAFKSSRMALVRLLDSLERADVTKASKHPRLKTPMRIIDLATFVAEHDDHHLASIRQRLAN